MEDNLDKNIVKKDINKLLKLIDETEIEIINNNKINSNKLNTYYTMLDTVIIEYHEVCKKLFK